MFLLGTRLAREGGGIRGSFFSPYCPGTLMTVFTMVTAAPRPNALPFSTVSVGFVLLAGLDNVTP